MTQPQAPGWYQDPMGRPGDARWWDGAGWTEAHTPRETTADDPQFAHLDASSTITSGTGAHTVTSPGGMNEYEVYVPPPGSNWQQPPPYDAPQLAQGSQDPSAPGDPDSTAKPSIFTRAALDTPTGSQRTMLWWGLGGLGVVALIVVLLVATGVFRAGDPDPTAGPGTYNSSPSQSQQAGVRVVDKAAGISYDYLGEGWQDYNLGTLAENQEVVGQYIVTQPKIPSGGEFIAQVTSGLLATQFGSPSPEQFAATLQEVEMSVRGNYYPQPNEATNVAEEQIQIDGAPAYRRSFDLEWNVEGYDSTGERVVLLLIDTGKSAPVFFYCSFPNTHAELYPLIDQVIASITVD
ncbi:DUF2510 domain-containing protein [Epidermidibacterium keratini]|uniref:DUF2510 domain-containing protein n=1 Tax=Epidermidibacterium keratini TaxID=1891644 RepID=A0A7L4YRB3_9ACTN|nr:DUF2510 domain-containing protein [Epidermidibacterium keratini]QHC01602.1 DUF2510 domain-containing protein [Epidermidibacterium keratini]